MPSFEPGNPGIISTLFASMKSCDIMIMIFYIIHMCGLISIESILCTIFSLNFQADEYCVYLLLSNLLSVTGNMITPLTYLGYFC